MSIFDRFKKSPKPNQMPHPEPIDAIMERSLFAEANILDFLGEEKTVFARGTREEKIQILERLKDSPESRTRILVWSELRGLGVSVPEELRKKVLGVVIEVGLYEGMDYLAAYEDHSARYYNFSGKKVVLESGDKETDSMIDQLLAAGQTVVMQLGLWDGARRKGVANDMVRLSFLTPAGLYFGEGPMAGMMQDPKGQPTIACGIELMKVLIARADAQAKH